MGKEKLTINLLSVETVERFNKSIMIARIKNGGKRVRQSEVFEKMVNDYFEKYCKPEIDQIKNDIFD